MPYESSQGRRCVASGCLNTEKTRYLLLNSKCNLHKQLRKNCLCESVFKFHKFPADSLERQAWVKCVNRKDVNIINSKRKSFVVCSLHFPDLQPTKENPYPVLHMQGVSVDQGSGFQLNTDSLTSTPENVEIEVQKVVTKLCDIICAKQNPEVLVDKEAIVGNSVQDGIHNFVSKSPSAELSEESLSARRNRRTIKQTYKARSFETEKLANRIRFGRPQNRSVLISLLRQRLNLPELKQCSVRLHRLDVGPTVKVSELKDYPFSPSKSNCDLELKISSFGSLSDELPVSEDENLVVKKELNMDVFHELDFEVDEECSEEQFTEYSPVSLKEFTHIVNKHDEIIPSPLKTKLPTTHSVVPQKLRKEVKKSISFAIGPKNKMPLKVKFRTPEKKSPSLNSSKAPDKSKKEYVKKLGKHPQVITSSKEMQQFQVPRQSASKGSVRHSRDIKVIKTYSKEQKPLKIINRKMEDYQTVKMTDQESNDKKLENISSSSFYGHKTNTLVKRYVNPESYKKNPDQLSKIWTKLHTYYDYTEEEEVSYSDCHDFDDESSYVIYEEEESDENIEETECEQCLADTLTEEKCLLYTGISLLVFKGLLGILKECAPKFSTTIKMNASDQVLLVLMKLKMGLINVDLAEKFNTTPATCGKIFSHWLTVMYDTLNHMVVWQSPDSIQQSMPKHFKEELPLTTCLIDTGYMSIQGLDRKPREPGQVVLKDSTTVKTFLFAVAPNGFVMFVSDLFDHDLSENSMLSNSGIKDKLTSGDHVLASKEFADGMDLPLGVQFDILPHLKSEDNKKSLSAESETALQRLKIFRILRGVITVPLSSASHVLHTCAALSNLGLIH